MKKVPFNQFLGFSKRTALQEAITSRTWSPEDSPFADTVGIHLYTDLDMVLGLVAGDEEAAVRTLEILQRYAWAADAVCEPDWLRILEVQGQRIHLFAETGDAGPDMVERLIRSCRVLHGLATHEIANLAGDASFSIRMAADFGRAILLRSTGVDDVSESVVSLGNPANRPAKHLTREVGKNGVPAGHLAWNTAASTEPDGNPEWELVNLEAELGIKAAAATLQLDEAVKGRFGQMVSFAAKDFEPNPKNPVHAPVKREGFMLRADLDGFSARVKDALARGDHAVLELVRAFEQIMKYPASFKDELPTGVTVVCFPWAGDCANLFLQCDDYTLEENHLPNTAALKWHRPKLNGTNWRVLLDKAKWLVAIAGGDMDQGHGNILTGNVIADGRTFHVGASWSWRRSLDAEQSEGTKANDTVIQNEDHAALDREQQRPYRDHPCNPSLFKVAPLDALIKTDGQEKSSAIISAPAIVPGLGVKVPAPKPYASL